MVFPIICPDIMQKRYTKKKYRLVLTKEAKRKLWLILPYRLRLRIEHFSYVANVIVKLSAQIHLNLFQRLFWMPVYRRCSLWLTEIEKLNNPYNPFTNAPVSDKEAEQRINNFLSRFTNA